MTTLKECVAAKWHLSTVGERYQICEIVSLCVVISVCLHSVGVAILCVCYTRPVHSAFARTQTLFLCSQ